MAKRDANTTTNTTTQQGETAGVGSDETPYASGLRIINPQARDTLEGKGDVGDKPIEPGEPETTSS